MCQTVWVYILKGAKGRHYTGMTNDPIRRMKEHRSGHSTTTRSYGKLDVLWMKGYKNREVARTMEVLIKRKGAAQFLKTYGEV